MAEYRVSYNLWQPGDRSHGTTSINVMADSKEEAIRMAESKLSANTAIKNLRVEIIDAVIVKK